MKNTEFESPDESELNDPTSAASRRRAARRTRASSAAVGVAILTALGCCAYQFAVERNPQALNAVYLMGFLGIALLIMEPASTLQLADEVRILRFYRSPRFYGIVVAISAGLVMVFAFVFSPVLPVSARALVRPGHPPEQAEAPAQLAPPDFPPLEVAGVILGGSRSSALVNGRTVLVGEYINDVKLAEVREDGVVVELRGFRKFVERKTVRALPPSPAKAAAARR